MAPYRQLAWPLNAALVLLLAYALDAGGYLTRIEFGVAEMRAKLLTHQVDSDIVIVEIDSHSLRELSEWPWPRRHYARLLQQLDRAAPKTLFIDIDLSSRSTPDDDQLLENALADWSGSPVLLATHFQLRNGEPDPSSLTRPLARFARHAGEVAVTLEQSRDGLVRAMRSVWQYGDDTIPSVFATGADLPPNHLTAIDFSISPSSFGSVAFSDLINGEVALDSLRGKTVYVGATAVELRDVVPVPVYRTLPGVVVQALATETVRAGALSTPPVWLRLVLLAACAATATVMFRRNAWRKNLLLLGGSWLLIGGASVYLYAAHRVDFPFVSFAAVLFCAFAAATLRSLDRATWRALAYAIRLKRRDALLRSIVESSADGILCVDASGLIRTANPATTRLLDCQAGQLIGAELARFLPALADGASLESRNGLVTDCLAVTAAGRRLPVEVSVSRVAVQDDPLYTAIIRDVSERVAQQRQLEHQARHDPLTGLPNRKALYEYLERLLVETTTGRRAALLLLDLTRFTEVNDTLGHDVGDEVLGEAARRLSDSVGQQAFVGRIGGDEFAVVLGSVGSRDAIDDLAIRLVDSLKPPMHARGVAIEVGANVGIALAPDHARGAQELLRRADVAMYGAKRNGTWFEYYEQGHDGHTIRRLSMTSELRAAIEGGDIQLHYQPQVNLETGRAEAVEALVRWRHPMLGNVPPQEFITLAESTSLIRPLTEWTIRRALTDLAAWEASGADLRVAVNLSARMLQNEDLARDLKRLLAVHSVDAGRLELEITESAMMLDPERALRIVRDLCRLGITISIDDFGTGFSSLGYLRDLHAHALKLDKSFVTDIEERPHNRVIVESTAQLAHALGLKIVAEGVETAGVLDYLTRAGFDFGQGYWFSPALPSAECLAWIERFNAAEQRRAG